MLDSKPYEFVDVINGSSTPYITGIVPYASDSDFSKVVSTPRVNQNISLRAYVNANEATYGSNKVLVVWDWRAMSGSDWNVIQRLKASLFYATPSGRRLLSILFEVNNWSPPTKNVIVRCSIYEIDPQTELPSETVTHSMSLGLQFSGDVGSASSTDAVNYNLFSASGMSAFQGRPCLWGVEEDSSLLFLSDYEDPTYFPYPNNCLSFDGPIVHCCEYLDSLLVFTTDKIFQCKFSDGVWTTSVIQSNLSISFLDKHLIQVIRNMVYFKSGNYYFMLVPKAQTLTGELTLAPITNPITSFFDNFLVIVTHVVEQTCDNTIFWKIYLFQSPHFFFPYKQNSTEFGRFASTSLCMLVWLSNRYMTIVI